MPLAVRRRTEAVRGIDLAISMPPFAAAAFLPFVAAITVWVAWSDMARMRIPNAAVLSLVAVYLVIGPVAMPLPVWAWQWINLAVVLVIGFCLNMLGLVGAGDAKFAAAAAPFVIAGDLAALLTVFSTVILAAYVTHRIARGLSPVRRMTPGWESWTAAKFPMGLALAPCLLFYIVAAAIG